MLTRIARDGLLVLNLLISLTLLRSGLSWLLGRISLLFFLYFGIGWLLLLRLWLFLRLHLLRWYSLLRLYLLVGWCQLELTLSFMTLLGLSMIWARWNITWSSLISLLLSLTASLRPLFLLTLLWWPIELALAALLPHWASIWQLGTAPCLRILLSVLHLLLFWIIDHTGLLEILILFRLSRLLLRGLLILSRLELLWVRWHVIAGSLLLGLRLLLAVYGRRSEWVLLFYHIAYFVIFINLVIVLSRENVLCSYVTKSGQYHLR